MGVLNFHPEFFPLKIGIEIAIGIEIDWLAPNHWPRAFR